MSSDYLKQTLLADEVRKAEVAGAVDAVLEGDVAPALAEDEPRDRQVLIRVGETQRSQWQAAAWRLERRYPDRWGRTRHEVTGADGGPVAVANWAELVTAARNKDKK